MALGIAVEVAFAVADPFTVPGASDWTDITPYVRRIDSRRGRQHLLQRTEPGTLSLTLANRDRRFDPENAAGPYFGNLRPMRRIRVRETTTPVPLWEGYVDNWPQSWSPRAIRERGDALVELQATDLFKHLSLVPLKPYSEEVLADEPMTYFPMQEPAGSWEAESLGSAPVTVERGLFAQFGEPGPLVGGATAGDGDTIGNQGWSTTDHFGRGFSFTMTTDHNTNGDLTLELWLRLDDSPAASHTILSDGYFYHWWRNADGSVTLSRAIDGGAEQVLSSAGFMPIDATWHHYAVTQTGRDIVFYRDGAEVERKRMGGHPALHLPGPPGGFFIKTPSGLESLDAGVAHVAVYNEGLTAARIGAHHAATYDAFVPMSSGTWIDTVLDLIGWPAGERVIDAGDSEVLHTPSGDALSELQLIAEESEGGLLQMTGDGKILFHGRQTLWKPPHLTPAVTYGDDAAESGYSDVGFRYDEQDLYTRARITREGGRPQEVADPAAAAIYGDRAIEKEGVKLTSDAEALDGANYLLYRFREPRLRAERVEFANAYVHDDGTAIVAADTHHDRIRLRRRPPGGGALIEQEAHVEGLHMTVTPPREWQVTWELITADPDPFWILGDSDLSLLGQTTRLGW